MPTLHTVNKSPYATNTFLSCLNHCMEGDSVLLIEDGVYGALAGAGLSDAVKAKLGAVKIHVLNEDVMARGLDSGRFLEGITGVDYGGFVDLVANNDRTQSWL